MRSLGTLAALALAACCILAISNAEPARAAGYVVDSTATTNLTNCTTTPNDCTLRGAINRANAISTPGDIITFDPAIFPPGAPATITITGVLPALLGGNDTVDGAGAGVIIDGSSEPSAFNCLNVDSNDNVVKNIQVTDCAAGIQVLTNHTGNTIGPGIIAFDNTSGISIIGNSNTVIGNKLGTNAAGTMVHPSGGNITDGITTLGDNVIIGTSNPADRNIISGNGTQGVRLQAGSNGITIKGNYIGLDINGTTDVGNTGNGITVLDSGNTIGGTAAGEGNVISGNNAHGISISGAGSNIVKGNFIGTDSAGNLDRGNTLDGINISASPSNTIGGDLVTGGSNVISGNDSDGIEITGVGANGNQVTANYLGVTAALSSKPNTAHGVRIAVSANNNVIGGADSARNYIAFNGADGVAVTAGVGNSIGLNSIFSNTGLGIDLGPDLVTPNDAAPDADSGANNLQNFPVLTLASYSFSGDTRVMGSLTSAFNTSYTVRFYHSQSCDGSGNGEGETVLATQTLATDGAGNAAIDLVISGGVPRGRFITATASDPLGNTSEFSNCLEAKPITVNSTVDPGDGICNVTHCVLREALTTANNLSGSDVIEFGIASGLQTIALTSSLPTITETAKLDATTQPGFAGAPLIELNGAGAGLDVSGLTIAAQGTTVRGLIINRFTGNGIVLQSGASNTLIEGNYIGTSAAGSADLGNALSGLLISANSADNLIGGMTPAARNVISGNDAQGIEISSITGGNQVLGNYVGTDAAGNADLGNTQNGISILGPNNNIGGTESGAGNVVSGNNSDGIAIQGAGATNNSVRGNLIGTNATGSAALGNSGAGVHVAGTPSIVIGGPSPAERNVISGNGAGVKMDQTSRNRVEGNYIGTNAAGNASIPNAGNGVFLDGGSRNTIGGTAAGVRNVISGNGAHGVSVIAPLPPPIQETSTDVPKAIPDVATINSNLTITDSAFVTDVNVTVTLTHTFDADLDISLIPPVGPSVELSTDNGGAGDNYTNTTFDDEAAVAITAGAAPFTGSFRPEGSLATLDGMQIAGNWRLRITDDSGGQTGTLTAWSLLLTTPGNKVQGNYIGTNQAGDTAVANGADGVYVEGDLNTIGGTVAGAPNSVAFNAGAGVHIASGIRNTYQRNSVHSNAGLGIDLDVPGVTPNDPGDTDSGPNQLQNFVVPTSAISSGTNLTVTGTLDSLSSTIFDILVYSSPSCDPSGNGEGQTYLGSFLATTNGSGIATFSQALPVTVTPGHFVTATAADPLGNTSEFSPCAPVGLDTDGDSFGSLIDGLPLFGDQRELQLGTDPSLACAATSTPNDEPIDPYPLDINDDGFIDIIADITVVAGHFGEAQTPSNIRFDLNLNGFIDLIGDLVIMASRFDETCVPP